LSDLDYPSTIDRSPSPAAGASASAAARSTERGVRRAERGSQGNREKIWLVSFMQYDLGFFDHESVRVECAPTRSRLKCYPCLRNNPLPM
jgi:hypothetical protein